MQKFNKFIVGLAVLILLIGTAMYLSRKHKPALIPAAASGDVAASSTNRAIVHAQRPATMADSAEETESAGEANLKRQKVEEYLRLHNRNAASLLAAFHSEPLGDMSYLYEAATNFPNDPRVQWTVLARNAFPEDRRKWLDNFKASSPSNSLGNYLSAQDYFKNNNPDAAMKELLAASGKSQFKDYSMDTILDGEDLGRFSGSSAMDTRSSSMGAMSGDMLPELANLKGIATNIRDLQQQYVNSGDMASVQNLAQMGLGLADRFSNGDTGKFLINQLVGIGAEAIVLDSLDKNTAYDFLGGETPAQRLAELKQERVSIRELSQNLTPILSTLSEDQMASYWERQKIYGELEAMRWLQQQNVPTPSIGN